MRWLPRPMTSSSRLPRILVSLLLAAGLLYALSTWGGVQPADVLDTLASITPAQWLAALGVHATIYLLRAWRFAILMPAAVRPRFSRVLAASSAHNLAAYVLPLKSGEGTFILYSADVAQVPARSSMASLLVSRLLDLIVLCAVMVLVTWSAPMLSGGMPTQVLGESPARVAGLISRMFTVGGVFLVVGLLATWVCLHRAGFVARTARLLRFFHVESTATGARLVAAIARFSGALDEAGARGGMWKATLVSVALWCGVICFYAVLLPAFGWPEGELVVVPAVLAAGFATLANLLPVNGFAGFGTQEGGWVVGMSLWGVDPELALAIGVSAHLVQLGNVCLFGVLGHLGLACMAREA